jgi:hypothetical protein
VDIESSRSQRDFQMQLFEQAAHLNSVAALKHRRQPVSHS